MNQVESTAITWTNELSRLFSEHQDPDQAGDMSRYMKNLFPFFGIKSPQRKVLLRSFLKAHPIPEEAFPGMLKQLWRQPQREMQYVATDLIPKFIKRQSPGFIETLEWCILHKSWWDTVDFLAPAAGQLFLQHPNLQPDKTNQWINHDNIWLKRSALLFQLKYRDQTDWPLLQHYILQTYSQSEFFIRKAIGWALRQYSKFAPDEVRSFVMEHNDKLSGLSQREALKWIERRGLS